MSINNQKQHFPWKTLEPLGHVFEIHPPKSSCDYRDRWQCPIIWRGKNTAQTIKKIIRLKNNTKVQSALTLKKPLKMIKEKLCLSSYCLPFSWHTCPVASIGLQRKHGQLQVSTAWIPWSCLNKQVQGMHSKQTSQSKFRGGLSSPSPTLGNTSSFTDRTGQKCHGHVAPLHLLNPVKAALDHSHLVNRLALKLAPKISFQFDGNVLPAYVPGTFCFDFFRASWGRRMLCSCLLAQQPRGDSGVRTGFWQGAPEPVGGSR